MGRPPLRYWISTLGRFVIAEIWKGPRAEIPLQFYKATVNTKKAIEEVCPETTLTEVKPAEVSAAMALKEIKMEELPKSAPGHLDLDPGPFDALGRMLAFDCVFHSLRLRFMCIRGPAQSTSSDSFFFSHHWMYIFWIHLR